ncbi:hypothetical protein Skr01_27020 [Sphaerisporangium krabiense]|uniref:Uncharacterized protein n=1 Tax=Sphaerisporangium krabiense TaxID=763782 RepID=A0A7W9DUH2_9ACTN|nr:hypothetical protein [Sphaerisporangium krabiense]MBB5630430.1 hypothetical protein [Sphaerisporangium krabiense]GII62617.1 hypothetical protein Skr01_27020 [Sphaerisporangium krabiense]
MLVLEVFSGATAVAVVGLAVGGVLARPGDRAAAAPVPFPAAVSPGVNAAAVPGDPGGAEVTAASAGSAKKAEKKRRDAEEKASGPSKHTDAKAVTYFKERWSGDKAVKRITDIRSGGKYLRIYTNLPESAHNSKAALDLCKRGMEYLLQEMGDQSPVVFVQARYGQNGNPVLANILGPGDTSCRLSAPRPR